MRFVAGPVALGLLVFAMPAVSAADDAAAPSLARARGELEELRFDNARRTLEASRRAGGLAPRDLAEVLALEAEVSAGLGLADDAERLFRHLLIIDPGATLRPGRAPKVVQPFEAARAFVAQRSPLRVHAERGDAGVVLVVDADVLGLVTAARLTVTGADGARVAIEAHGSGRFELAIPSAARPPFVAEALDAFANGLVEVTVPDRSPAAVAPTRPAEAPAPRPGILGRWGVWAGGSVALGLAASAFALDQRRTSAELEDVVAHSPDHDYGEYVRLDRRQTRDALVANLGFALAAGAAVTATVLYLREGSTVLVAAPASPSGGVAAEVRVAF